MPRFARDDRGSVAVIFGLMSMAVIGIAGIALDYARAKLERQRLSAAADAAALAAAAVPESERSATAQRVFASNYPERATVTVELNGDSVRVAASTRVPTTLLLLIGRDDLEVGTQARALARTVRNCIYLLHPTDIGLIANSGADLDADCGIQVNSGHAEAVYVNSGSHIVAAQTRVTGRSRINGGSITPPPADGSPAVSDPLAGLAEPSEATRPCDHRDLTVQGPQSRTLSPGVYCGKTEINDRASVTLSPGIYVFRNGEFAVNSSARVTGRGVMMFFADKDARLNVNSDGAFDVTALQSGPYAGMLLFQGRNPDNAGAPPFIFNSNSDGRLEGTIYLPQGTLEANALSNTNSRASYTSIVAQRLVLNSFGTLTVRSDYRGSTPLPARLGNVTQGVVLTH